MPLDLSEVARQVEGVAGRLREGQARYADRRRAAVRQLEDWDARWEALDEIIARIPDGGLLWRPPRLSDGLRGGIEPIPCPTDYTVLAVDGSHVEPDRHRSVDCYLANIGQVTLRYGSGSRAILTSDPALYLGQPDADESERSSDPDMQEEMDRAAITASRTLQEMRTLAALASTYHDDGPVLAFIDGSLIWNLGRYLRPGTGPGGREQRLLRQYAGELQRLRETAQGRKLVLAGYVSFPGSHEVDDALRVAACPALQEGASSCSYCRPLSQTPPGQRPCDVVGETLDRDIFSDVLAAGERSAVFRTNHKQIQLQVDEADWPCFYYLRTADEMVRVEVPRWVADDPDLLALSHTLTLDQANRGRGYPEALMEADALAAVSPQDRIRFWELVERQLAGHRIAMTTSAKSRSKRLRWI